jgi:hypothetical protein
MNDSDDLSTSTSHNYQMMSGRMPRQQQGNGRSLIRNPSYNSDSSRTDEIETVDMEMSDDDTGVIDNQSVGSSTGEGELLSNMQLMTHLFILIFLL